MAPSWTLVSFGTFFFYETLPMRVNYVGDGGSFFRTEKARWILEYDFDGEKYWEPQEAAFPFLESIMICACNINEPYVIPMMKFLMKNAPELKKIVISTEKIFTSEQLLDL